MIEDRVAAVRQRIARAAERASRLPEEVTLVAVSKTWPAEAVRAAFAAGVRHFGENRVQEADAKIEGLTELRASGLRWHLVGHLQSNKARKAAALFDVIQSVHSVELAGRLARAGADLGRTLRVLVQVDLAGEAGKSGLAESAVEGALRRMRDLDGLRVEGLMVLPPYLDDPEEVRPYFARLRGLRDRVAAAGLLDGTELSMGMSHDFETAVEEGATIVRVGTAIFGERTAAA
ncbi:MAG: YggS family pyridoxal phosphate-dependent enzyme [Acidobacteria bacterium]|nr:YggS family pyridoxal phosphate-dependent enzyme [Acidobacteriota bacterium]